MGTVLLEDQLQEMVETAAPGLPFVGGVGRNAGLENEFHRVLAQQLGIGDHAAAMEIRMCFIGICEK